jgi:hypothetical protein
MIPELLEFPIGTSAPSTKTDVLPLNLNCETSNYLNEGQRGTPVVPQVQIMYLLATALAITVETIPRYGPSDCARSCGAPIFK